MSMNDNAGVSMLGLTADFLPESLMSSDDLAWLARRLVRNGRDTGNLFTAADAIELLGK